MRVYGVEVQVTFRDNRKYLCQELYGKLENAFEKCEDENQQLINNISEEDRIANNISSEIVFKKSNDYPNWSGESSVAKFNIKAFIVYDLHIQNMNKEK
jgi:hypothetical protein